MQPGIAPMEQSRMVRQLAIVLTTLAAGAWAEAKTADRPLLRDGFALRGVEGTLSKSQGARPGAGPYTGLSDGDSWFFELRSDVNDERVVAKAGTRLELLPSATLEKMITDMGSKPQASYVLLGSLTKYKDRNYLFPHYFMRLVDSSTAELREPNKPQVQREQPAKPSGPQAAKGPAQKPVVADQNDAAKDKAGQDTTDTNDLLGIPKEVLDELKAGNKIGPRKLIRPAEQTQQLAKDAVVPTEQSEVAAPDANQPGTPRRAETRRDSAMANRTAVLVKLDSGWFAFTLDALGRNVEGVSLLLLPCEALELTEQVQGAALEPPRFTIAGIATTYKGRRYLLLQRAARIYTYENFGEPFSYR